jgi:hypothetical protein
MLHNAKMLPNISPLLVETIQMSLKQDLEVC